MVMTILEKNNEKIFVSTDEISYDNFLQLREILSSDYFIFDSSTDTVKFMGKEPVWGHPDGYENAVNLANERKFKEFYNQLEIIDGGEIIFDLELLNDLQYVIENLRDYPVICDETLSDIESEIIEEFLEQWGYMEFFRGMPAVTQIPDHEIFEFVHNGGMPTNDDETLFDLLENYGSDWEKVARILVSKWKEWKDNNKTSVRADTVSYYYARHKEELDTIIFDGVHA